MLSLNKLQLKKMQPLDHVEDPTWSEVGSLIIGDHHLGAFEISPSTLNGKYPLHYVLRFEGRFLAAHDTVDEAKMDASDFLNTLVNTIPQ